MKFGPIRCNANRGGVLKPVQPSLVARATRRETALWAALWWLAMAIFVITARILEP